MGITALLTLDDLETAVPTNAQFEANGDKTILLSAMDKVESGFAKNPPEVVIITGAIHERPARELIAAARSRSISTLGLLETTEPQPLAVARQLGLTGWMVKPVEPAQIVAAAHRLNQRRRLQDRTGIIGESPAIQEVLVKIEQMAPVSSTVLIEGESGTGKELVAHAIHELSPRRSGPFIAVNCSALPENLLESELFGHEKGAFTGASERRLGRFELADSGTLFLDEIGDMTPGTQVKLLRVLEERSFFRVGGAKPIHVDVRVVAATNRPLKEAAGLGHFREDLYFRLNVLSIYLPPLRERKSDIPTLVEQFIEHFSKEHNRPFKGITPEAMQILANAQWPGNVRQLQNLVESMVVLAPGQEIRASDIPKDVREQGDRLLPVPIPIERQDVGGKELEFIFRSLVDLKLQIEELRRRMDDEHHRVEVIDMGPEPRDMSEQIEARPVSPAPMPVEVEEEHHVLYEAGMTMADVEKAAIEGALAQSEGNRRQAAEMLGIGERTLYRKIKEFGLD